MPNVPTLTLEEELRTGGWFGLYCSTRLKYAQAEANSLDGRVPARNEPRAKTPESASTARRGSEGDSTSKSTSPPSPASTAVAVAVAVASGVIATTTAASLLSVLSSLARFVSTSATSIAVMKAEAAQ